MTSLSEIENNPDYKWLVNSIFYNELKANDSKDEESSDDESDDDESSRKKLNVIICKYNETDLEKYLNVIRFWGVSFLPEKFWELFFKKNNKKIISNFAQLDENFEFLFNFILYDENKFELGLENKRTDLLIYLFKIKPNKEIKNIYNEKEDNLHLDCIKFLYEKGIKMDKYYFRTEAYNGNLKCLKFLHSIGCKCDKKAIKYALIGEHFECEKFMKEIGCGL